VIRQGLLQVGEQQAQFAFIDPVANWLGSDLQVIMSLAGVANFA
jgi:hypothetical protein